MTMMVAPDSSSSSRKKVLFDNRCSRDAFGLEMWVKLTADTEMWEMWADPKMWEMWTDAEMWEMWVDPEMEQRWSGDAFGLIVSPELQFCRNSFAGIVSLE